MYTLLDTTITDQLGKVCLFFLERKENQIYCHYFMLFIQFSLYLGYISITCLLNESFLNYLNSNQHLLFQTVREWLSVTFVLIISGTYILSFPLLKRNRWSLNSLMVEEVWIIWCFIIFGQEHIWTWLP